MQSLTNIAAECDWLTKYWPMEQPMSDIRTYNKHALQTEHDNPLPMNQKTLNSLTTNCTYWNSKKNADRWHKVGCKKSQWQLHPQQTCHVPTICIPNLHPLQTTFTLYCWALWLQSVLTGNWQKWHRMQMNDRRLVDMMANDTRNNNFDLQPEHANPLPTHWQDPLSGCSSWILWLQIMPTETRWRMQPDGAMLAAWKAADNCNPDKLNMLPKHTDLLCILYHQPPPSHYGQALGFPSAPNEHWWSLQWLDQC